MRKLTNKVRKVLPKIKCPALVIHSKADLLSPQSNISLVYDTISSENKEKMIVENGGHNLFISNPDQKIIFKKIMTGVPRLKPTTFCMTGRYSNRSASLFYCARQQISA